MSMSGSFDRFTERARTVLTLAENEAQRFNHTQIGPEHLLLGLIAEGEGVAAKVLSNLGVELTKVRRAVELIIGRSERPTTGEIGLTPQGKKVIELAVDEARRLGHHYIGTEHLLLGLVRQGGSTAAGVLESLGVNLEKARSEVIRILTQSGSTPRHGARHNLRREYPPPERWEYVTVQAVHSGGMARVRSVNGHEDPRLIAQHTPLHEAFRQLGEEGWELVGLDPPSLYIFKRLSA